MSPQDFGDSLVRLYFDGGNPAVKSGLLSQMLTPGADAHSMPQNTPPKQSLAG